MPSGGNFKEPRKCTFIVLYMPVLKFIAKINSILFSDFFNEVNLSLLQLEGDIGLVFGLGFPPFLGGKETIISVIDS